MLDASGLIEKHRSNGVLVDANLLVLYLVGKVNKNRIPTFKRTQGYTARDFVLLAGLIGHFGRAFTTPHILSQVSDLSALPGKELKAIRHCLKAEVEMMEERYDESRMVVKDAAFEPLGLADAAIVALCRRPLLVLTADLALYLALQRRGADAINFTDYLSSYWR